jgi:hypothetical protein
MNERIFEYSTTVFLELDFAEHQASAEGCQGYRKTKMRNDKIVLLAALHLYVRTKVYGATVNANHSVTDSRQTINRCISPEAS